MNYTAHLQDAIEQADQHRSYLSADVLNLPGMSSPKVRHLLNNVVGPQSRYLEVGVWKGSTFVSALYSHGASYHCAIDNFSQFGRPRAEFQSHAMRLLGYPPNLLDIDCFTIDPLERGIHAIDVYFYDGDHTEDSQYRALKHFLPAMANEFVYIVDDYNWPQVQKGTQRAVADLSLRAPFSRFLASRGNGDVASWWNGLWVAHLAKPSTSR